MAVFNVSFANSKTRTASQDYGPLVDQLDIMESSLSADGKLSPGDYKLLTSKAQALYGHPGLTPGQRSNIEVKIAGYRSASSKSSLKDMQDISRLSNEVADDQRKASILFGNNPKKFIETQAAVQHARVNQLADAINTLDASGQDSSSHVAEYNQAVNDYQDTLQALQVVEGHGKDQAPHSDYVAYITTNNNGEIIDVNVGREGSNSGYLETNGLYGGLKIYGKLNRKENGKNVFLLGSQRYSAVDTVIPGPDGSLKASTLVNEAQQRGKRGVFSQATAGYTDMDPTTTRTQTGIRAGGYAMGSNGFIYKKNMDGSFTKYVNATPDNLKISENDIIKIPKAMESSLVGNVTTTVDAANQPIIPITPTMNSMAPAGGSSTTPATMGPTTSPAAPSINGRPPAQPSQSSPSTFGNVISKTVQSAKGFLGRLFGE